MADLSKLLRPKSIAVVGGAAAARVVLECQKMGFDGDIWPVHPKKTAVEGLPAYTKIEDLPGVPDVAFIGVNRHLTIEAVEALSAMGAGGAVCYASGFLEADETGASLQRQLLQKAGEMPVIGPNCYGMINYVDGALLWPDNHGGKRLQPDESGVAIITQSSNIAINLTMQSRGLALAYVLTAGNQAVVGSSDLAMAALDDSRVSCLGMHIEGFDSVQAMEVVARKARILGKPIIVLKIGKSEQAQAGALSHTASLAGAYGASKAFLQRIGVGQVESLPALLETLKLLHVHGPLSGYRMGSMSCSGGEASLVADASQGRKVIFPPLSEAEKAAVQEPLGPMVTVNNPLDYHTYIWADLDKMREVFTSMLMADHDLTMLVLDFPRRECGSTEDWDIALAAYETAVQDALQLRGAKASKPVITVSLSENITEQEARALQKRGIVAIGGVDETMVAAEVAADIGIAWLKPVALPVIQAAQAAMATDLRTPHLCDEAMAKSLLSSYGVPVPAAQVVISRDEAISVAKKLGYPVVLKALGLAHKTEHNAVYLNLKTDAELEQALTQLSAISERFYLEAMVQKPVAELIIGITRDPQFGLVMTIGAGGVLVELLKDSQTLLLPASDDAIESAIQHLKTAAIFNGYRGKAKADLTAAVAAIQGIQRYAQDHVDKLLELDVNPLIVCEQGHGAIAADALIVLNEEIQYV